MNEIELGSCNFAFQLTNIAYKQNFLTAGMAECRHKLQDVITKSGVYALKMSIVELKSEEEKEALQEMPVELQHAV